MSTSDHLQGFGVTTTRRRERRKRRKTRALRDRSQEVDLVRECGGLYTSRASQGGLLSASPGGRRVSSCLHGYGCSTHAPCSIEWFPSSHRARPLRRDGSRTCVLGASTLHPGACMSGLVGGDQAWIPSDATPPAKKQRQRSMTLAGPLRGLIRGYAPWMAGFEVSRPAARGPARRKLWRQSEQRQKQKQKQTDQQETQTDG